MYKKEPITVKIFIAVFFSLSAIIYLSLCGICLERAVNAGKIEDDYGGDV